MNHYHCRPRSSSSAVGVGVGMSEGSTHESNKDGPHINPYSKRNYNFLHFTLFFCSMHVKGSTLKRAMQMN